MSEETSGKPETSWRFKVTIVARGRRENLNKVARRLRERYMLMPGEARVGVVFSRLKARWKEPAGSGALSLKEADSSLSQLQQDISRILDQQGVSDYTVTVKAIEQKD